MGKARNYGIDLLRIIATFMIIVLHILEVGGIIYTIDASHPVYITAWGLEFAAYCAVNCYALISGYVGLYSKSRISNLLQLWIQVMLTTVAITCFMYFFGVEVTVEDFKEAFTPITSQLYWYFTAYVCLSLSTPFLNLFVLNLNKRMSKYLLVIFAILFSVMPIFWEADLFQLNWGYSAAWLVVLYIVGAIIRKYYTEIQIKKRLLFAGYLVAVILTLLSKIGIEFLTGKYALAMWGSNFLMNYNSPTMVMAGVCLLLLFAKLELKKMVRPIAFFAPFTFGVYIIHSHPIIWDKVMTNGFTRFTDLTPLLLVLNVLATATAIFMLCSLIEFVRIKMFKILHISEYCKFVERKIQLWCARSGQ